jgi:hypothetical protein
MLMFKLRQERHHRHIRAPNMPHRFSFGFVWQKTRPELKLVPLRHVTPRNRCAPPSPTSVGFRPSAFCLAPWPSAFFLLLLHHSQVEHFTKKENREGYHPHHPHHREKSSANHAKYAKQHPGSRILRGSRLCSVIGSSRRDSTKIAHGFNRGSKFGIAQVP